MVVILLGPIEPFKLIIISSIIAILISDCRNSDELNVLGNLIVAIGGLVLVVAAQKELINKNNEQEDAKEDIMKQIEILIGKYKICKQNAPTNKNSLLYL
jgi:hypothetical protein